MTDNKASAAAKALSGVIPADMKSGPLKQVAHLCNVLEHLRRLAWAEVNDRVERARHGRGQARLRFSSASSTTAALESANALSTSSAVGTR
jgi:hypothetical protein